MILYQQIKNEIKKKLKYANWQMVYTGKQSLMEVSVNVAWQYILNGEKKNKTFCFCKTMRLAYF